MKVIFRSYFENTAEMTTLNSLCKSKEIRAVTIMSLTAFLEIVMHCYHVRYKTSSQIHQISCSLIPELRLSCEHFTTLSRTFDNCICTMDEGGRRGKNNVMTTTSYWHKTELKIANSLWNIRKWNNELYSNTLLTITWLKRSATRGPVLMLRIL